MANTECAKLQDHYRLLSKNIPKLKAKFFEVICSKDPATKVRLGDGIDEW